MYLVKTPWWLKAIYPSLIWHMPTSEKVLYLTFDDGPHPIATPFVLNVLEEYDALATFFCIGKNVLAEPKIYNRIIADGHTVGNHTQNHLNGWKNTDANYLADVSNAAQVIKSNLFRPPYGRIKKSQAKAIRNLPLGASNTSTNNKIIMWDVLSGDFDTHLSKQKCAQYVTQNASKGSIIVFHDSAKAWERMSFALPQVLKHFAKLGFCFKAIPS